MHALLARRVYVRKARIHIVLPTGPLLHRIGHGDDGKRRHFPRREGDALGTWATSIVPSAAVACACSFWVNSVRLMVQKQIDQVLGLLSTKARKAPRSLLASNFTRSTKALP